jgi:hypothetical protein
MADKKADLAGPGIGNYDDLKGYEINVFSRCRRWSTFSTKLALNPVDSATGKISDDENITALLPTIESVFHLEPSNSISSSIGRASVCRVSDNAVAGEPHAQLAKDTLKDPYIFDFLTLDKPFRERELEAGLVGQLD